MALDLFAEHVTLLLEPYVVRSTEDWSIFDSFVRSLLGEEIEINARNFRVLDALCREFGFDKLLGLVEEYKQWHSAVSVSPDVQRLERRVEAQSRLIEWMRREVQECLSNFELLSENTSEIRLCVGRDLCDIREELRVFRESYERDKRSYCGEVRDQISNLVRSFDESVL